MQDARFALGVDADERELLTTFLEFQRDALVRKCEGLSDAQLRSQPIPASRLSLVGLVRHLATVENWYFRQILGGEGDVSPYDYATDEAFTDLANANRLEAFETWRRQVDAARLVTARLQLDSVAHNPSTGIVHSLRWVLVHMIDEYARHLGHADLLRESLDGAIGE